MKASIEYQKAVVGLMAATKEYLHNLELIPRDNDVDAVLLALLSKSIVLTEAIAELVAKGFDDEAFGLCRSCLELQFIVRHLVNKNTLERSRRYSRYFAKVTSVWFKLFAKYYPNVSQPTRADSGELDELAAAYTIAHKWAEDELKYFACEPDSFESREDGTPFDQRFVYDVLYKWTSYYVHVTEHSIDPAHVTVPGDVFKVHPRADKSRVGGNALRIAFQMVNLNLIHIFRFFNMSYPEHLSSQYAELAQSEMPQT